MRNEALANIVPEHIVPRGSLEMYLLQPRSIGVYEPDLKLPELQILFDSASQRGQYETILEGEGKQQTLTVVQKIQENRSLIGEGDDAKVEIRTTYRADGAMKEVRTHREGSNVPDTLISFEYDVDTKDPTKIRLASSTSSFVDEDKNPYLSIKAIYKRNEMSTVTNVDYERGDAGSLTFSIGPNQTLNIHGLRAAVEDTLQLAKRCPNAFITVDDTEKTILTVFAMAPGIFTALPVSMGVYRYTIENGLVQQTERLEMGLQTSGLQEIDREVIADEAFIAKHQYALVSNTVSRRGERPYITEVRPFDPNAQSHFIE